MALGALVVSLVSATLFVVGVSGDPHEGPLWLAFFALLWPVFLCPLSCLSWLYGCERQQPLSPALTLAIAASAGILPWLPGIISFKLWLSPDGRSGTPLRRFGPVALKRSARDQALRSLRRWPGRSRTPTTTCA